MRHVCVRGAIIASREAAGALLRCEPMTLKSCTARLPNNRPDRLKSDTSPPLEHHCRCSLWFQASRSARGQAGETSTSFKSCNPHPTPPNPHHPHHLSHHQASTSCLTLICTSKPQQRPTSYSSADTNDLSRWVRRCRER